MTIISVHGDEGSVAQQLATASRLGAILLISGEQSGALPLPLENSIANLQGPPEHGLFNVTVSETTSSWSGHAVFESGVWRAHLLFPDGSSLSRDFNPDEELEPGHRSPEA